MLKPLFAKSTIVLVLMCLIFSCTYTSTIPKKANFKVESAKMEENFKALVTCERVDINGTESKTSKQVTSNLEIRIINGSNIPTDNDQMKSLGKSIASQFKQELSDTNDFNTYRVSFVIAKSNGLIGISTTNAYTFKSEEL